MSTVQSICPYCKQKSACFQNLDQSELDFADKNKVQIHYKEGETIVKQGSFVTHVFYVKEGLVKIYREYEDNANLIYNILPRGTLIGLSNLYVGSTFQFSVAALTNSSICSIDKSFMEQLLRDNGAFAKSVVESVNNEIHQLQEKLVSLTHKPLKGRLADSLVFLSREVFESRQFSHKLSRKDLAEFSGMSMMSLVRTLQEFMREGYVEEVDGKLNLLDMDALKVF